MDASHEPCLANGSQFLSPDQRIAAVGYAMVAGGLAPGVTIPASQVATPPPGMVLIPTGASTMGNSLDGLDDATPTVSTNGYRLLTEAEWEKAARGGLAGFVEVGCG